MSGTDGDAEMRRTHECDRASSLGSESPEGRQFRDARSPCRNDALPWSGPACAARLTRNLHVVARDHVDRITDNLAAGTR
jgi:hypothetical protein